MLTLNNVNNNNSIGIEVVGMPVDQNGNTTTDQSSIAGWQDLTDNQVESTSQAISTIMEEYNLTQDNIFPHEDVSRKTEGEGRTVLNAVRNRVNQLSPPVVFPPALDSSIQGNSQPYRF